MSAKYVVCRALLVRADFAIAAKLSLRNKMKKALKVGDQLRIQELQADVPIVDWEVSNTYEVLKHFQDVMPPRLDASVEALQHAQDKLKIPSMVDDKH